MASNPFLDSLDSRDTYLEKQKKLEEERQAQATNDAIIQAQKDANTAQGKNADGTGKGFVADTIKNATDLGKGIVGGLQQGAGVLADVALEGGMAVGSIGASDKTLLEQNKNTKIIRDKLHGLADINGNAIQGTSNVDENARKIATGSGNAQDVAAVAGKGLEAGLAATSFANPTSLAKGAIVGQTGKALAGDLLKSSAVLGTTGGVQTGLQTYSKDGNVGNAIVEGGKSAVMQTGANLLLGGAGIAAGKVIKGLKGSKATDATTPTAETPTATTPTTDAAKTPLELGAGYRDPSVINNDIQALQNGTDKSVMDVTTASGKNFTAEDIAAATQKQTDALTQQKDVLNSKLAAQDSGTPMYEDTVKQIDTIDKQIADTNASGVTPTGEPIVSTVVNPDKVREKFTQLQQEAATVKEYNNNIAKAGLEKSVRPINDINSEIASLKSDKLPDTMYDNPKPVQSAEEIALHPNLPEPIKRSGQIITIDKSYAEQQLSQLMTPDNANTAKNALDAQYKAKIDALKDVPEIRAANEKATIDQEYQQHLDNIDGLVQEDAPKVAELTQAQQAIKDKEISLLGDINQFQQDYATQLRTPNQERITARLNELQAEKYTAQTNPVPAETTKLMSDSVDAGVAPSESTNIAVQKAVDNTIDESVNLADNTGKNPGIISAILGVPREVMTTWGSAGKAAAELLSNATDRIAISDSNFGATLQKWSKAAGGNKGLNNVAKALDGNGEAFASLSDAEMTVFHQSRDYLNGLADKMGLPQDAQLSDYFPHIFKESMSSVDAAIKQLSVGKNLSGAELTAKEITQLQKTISGIDYETIQLIDRNSMYTIKNGFLKERTGAKGYDLNFADTMNAYSHAANRTIHMQPALTTVKELSKSLTAEQNTYLAKVVHAAGGRPTDEIGSQLNTTLQGIIGTENSAYSKASSATRKLVYDATMGLNPGSALRNFSQNSNTYAKLGEIHFIRGMWDGMKSFNKSNGMHQELVEAGVLHNKFSDLLRSGNDTSLKGKADKVLWGMFTGVEQLNRSTAYFGGKAKALAAGATEAEAKLAGRDMSRVTNFEFGVMDTPIALQSTTAKNLIQFQSYNLSQVKFLAGIVGGKADSLFVKGPSGYKIQPKAALEISRYIGFNLLFVGTVGAAMGMKPTDMIPFYSDIVDGNVPKSPIVKTLFGDKSNKGVFGLLGEANNAMMGDKTSQDTLGKDTGTFAAQTAALLVPAGSQIKKGIEGVGSITEGQSKNSAGNTRFLQNQDDGSKLQALLFGQYATKNGQAWLANDMPTLSDKQTQQLQGLSPDKQKQYYDYYTLTKKATGRDSAVSGIKDAAKAGDINTAARLGKEYNDKVDQAMSKYWGQNNDLPLRLKDNMIDTLRIDVSKVAQSSNDKPSTDSINKENKYLQNDLGK